MIKTRLTLATFIALLLVSGLAFAQDFKSGATVKMAASIPVNDVNIGDMIQIDLVFTNLAATNTEIVKPIIDIDSVTFVIKHFPAAGMGQPWASSFSRITPSVDSHDRKKLEKVTLGISGTPEASLKVSFTLPAVEIADWDITVFYQGMDMVLISNSVRVKINGPKAEDGSMKKGELIAVIETSTGTMTCRFFLGAAPNTVMNFCKLAAEGSYNNLTFHRIIKDFMIQGGDPKGDGSGGPGYSIRSEVNSNKHIKGTLAMARSAHLDSAGSQFYLCLAPQPNLDSGYTTFGQLIDGMSVLEAIGNVATTGSTGKPPDRPLEAVVIKKISLEFKESK